VAVAATKPGESGIAVTENKSSPLIGTLGEKSLHAALKRWCAQPGDRFEVQVDDFVIDIVRGEVLVEIQTRNFSAMRRKLERLLPRHPVRLIHPIAREKWIVRETGDGRFLKRRKSPKRGRVEDVFRELVRIPDLLANPNLTLEVLFTQEEEIWRDDGKGSWRRKRWSIHDRRLLAVVDNAIFVNPTDYLSLLPPDLPQPFTNRDLATVLKLRLNLAQKMSYTLRKAGWLEVAGKRGNALLFESVF
jgi:hypothetical protein